MGPTVFGRRPASLGILRMNIAKWIKEKLSRTRTWRRRCLRKRFEEQFAAELMVKPLENRFVLSTNELAITLNAAGVLNIADAAGNYNDAISIRAEGNQYAITDLTGNQTLTFNGAAVGANTAFVS